MLNISSNTPNYLHKKIEQTNKEYNEYIKKHDIVNPKNDGSVEIKSNNNYKGFFEFMKEKDLEKRKNLYEQTKNMSQNDRYKYIYQRYYDKNASHYIGEGFTDRERKETFRFELGYNPTKYKTYGYNLSDPMFRGIKTVMPDGFVEKAGKNLFNRTKINQAISNILERKSITIPKNEKLTFSIEPFSYKISVNGTDDKNLKLNLENALNVGENGKELFFHISQTLPSDSAQRTDDINYKYSLMTAIRDETGYNINELKKEGRTLVNDKGEDVFALFEKNIMKNQLKHLSDSDKAVVVGSYRLMMYDFIDGSLKDTPDKVLKIDYQDGSLLDKDTTKGYGKGQTSWLNEMKEKLRKTVAYNELGDTKTYKKSGNFFDSKNTDLTLFVNQDKNTDLDIYLDPKTKAMKIALEQQRAKIIAIKVAKGEKLTKEELNLIKEYSPELLQKAKIAHQQASIFKQNNDTNNINDKMQILAFVQNLSKQDELLGELMMNALD